VAGTGLRSTMVRSLDVMASASTIGAVALALWLAWGNYRQLTDASGAPQTNRTGASALVGRVVAVGPRVRTAPGARAVILEFSDFQCQYCRSYVKNLYPTVLRELVDSGKAEYAYRHFPIESIHGKALAGGQAAECAAEQGRFWEMHDELFKQPLSDDDIRRHVRKVGLNTEAFDACVQRGDAGARVKEDLAEATRLGIAGTPTFLVGTTRPDGQMMVVRVLEGAPALRVLTEAVDEALRTLSSRT
jgi:protein-disulfide isomerase